MVVNGHKMESQEVRERSKGVIDFDLFKMGRHLIVKMHTLIKTSQVYDAKNTIFQQFLQESLQSLNALIRREGELSLKIVQENLFINRQRLRYSIEGFTSYKFFLTFLKNRLIGEIIFRKPLDDLTLTAFIYDLIGLKEEEERNADLLSEQLVHRGISWIEVNPVEVFEGEAERMTLSKEGIQKMGKTTYFESIRTIKEVITQMMRTQHADVRKLKLLALRTVYLLMKDESHMLGLTTIKNYDDYTFNHSVNVSIYSMAIGRRLGFSKKLLTDLGIAGFLHDIGKAKIPKEILNKPGKLDEIEWGIIKNHPLQGVEIVLKLKQLGGINPRIVMGIFDHHLKSSLSGYPKLFRKTKVSLFGRIIQIADVYDALSTPRVYRKEAFTPEQALAIMLKDGETEYDPILLKTFIGLVGIYPIGSLVLLNTNEMGIVYKLNPDSQLLNRPQVILVEKDDKGGTSKKSIDLAETDEKGQFKWNIVKPLDPYKYHIDLAKYFM